MRQMTTSRLESEGGSQTQALPLFLITLEWDKKSQQIFKLTHLNHVSIQVEAYRALTGLKQWYNCQQFGHVWAPCKQPPHCWWCGGGHRHKECPEKDNKNSSPSCCNCNLAERERQYPRLQVGQGRNASPKIPASSTQKCVRTNYHLQAYKPIYFIHSRPDEQQQRHPGQPTQSQNASGSQQQATQFTAQATRKETKSLNTSTHKDTEVHNASLSSGQSVQANSVNSATLNDMFK